MIKNVRYEVLTKSGFKHFKGLKKTSRKENVKFTFSDETSIVVTPEHRFLVGKCKNGKIFRKAHKIKVNHKLGKKMITKIEKNVNCSNNFYDLVGVDGGNHYITSGVTSHNCAYINKGLWDEFVDSVMPTMNSLIFKQVIMTSTANGMNHFEQIVRHAKLKDSDERFITCSWRDVPHYKKNGELYDPDEYKKTTIKRYGRKFFLQTEACNFLGSSETLVGGESLKLIEERVKEVESTNKILQGLNVYKDVQEGNKYILSVDPSKDGIDDFSIAVTDVSQFPFEQVATANLQVDYIQMPEHLSLLGEYYNTALIIVENNEGAGQSITDTLWGVYEYENLYRDKNIDGRVGFKKYTGFRTTPKSRNLITTLMKLFIEEGKLIINSDVTLKQLYTFTKNKNGKYVAEEGYKDDAVMAQAIAFAPFMENKRYDNYQLFVKELKTEDSTAKTGQFLSEFDIGSVDDGTGDYEEQQRQAEMREQFMSELGDEYGVSF